jgi:hypothetical protein
MRDASFCSGLNVKCWRKYLQTRQLYNYQLYKEDWEVPKFPFIILYYEYSPVAGRILKDCISPWFLHSIGGSQTPSLPKKTNFQNLVNTNMPYIWDNTEANKYGITVGYTKLHFAGSIPGVVIGIFYWHNPSGRTMALGLTQPLTEISTRNISCG